MASYYLDIYSFFLPFKVIFSIVFIIFMFYQKNEMFSMFMLSVSAFGLVVIEAITIPVKVYFNFDCSIEALATFYIFIRSLQYAKSLNNKMQENNIKLKDVIKSVFSAKDI